MLATFAISPERAKSVWFSTPYGATGSVLMAPEAAKIKSWADLAGKKVSVARGSFTEQALAQNAPPTSRSSALTMTPRRRKPWWPDRSMLTAPLFRSP